MEGTALSAERIRDELLARSTSTRKRNTVARLWRALEHLRSVHSHDFSLANVARTIESLGLEGPAEQTLRNNRDFRNLIAAYASEHGGKKRKPAEEDELLATIPDLGTRAAVRLLQADNASLKRRNDMLHNLIRGLELRTGAVAAVVAGATDGEVSALPAPTTLSFTRAEIHSVDRFLGTMGRDHGWEADETTGAVVWASNGMEVAGPGFYNALRKIADLR